MFVTGGNKVEAFRNVRIAAQIKALVNVCEPLHAFFFICGTSESVIASRQSNSPSAKHGTPVLRIIIRTVRFRDRGYDLSYLRLVEEVSQAAHIFPLVFIAIIAIDTSRLALKLTYL